MLMRATLVVYCCCLLTTSGASHADELKLTKVKARTLELLVPNSWKQVPVTKDTRAAQFEIGDGDSKVDLVVFYFGGPTGGVKLNVDRWVGQFDAKDRKIEMFQGKCKAGSYILVDAIGTWNKPDGPPFARKTISTPNSRALNVIVVEEKDGKKDYYFMKLSGEKEAVADHVNALRTAIGAKRDTEKPFALKDAPN